jgi:predicted metal-dependent phosphoesterase TrpH
VLVDFHTHSRASDGMLPPAELLARAAQAGISEFAITDHDTLAGFRAVAAPGVCPRVHSGVELSCQWAGAGIHVVGLGFDPDHPTLAAGLARLARARRERAQTIADRLESRGFAGALAGAAAVAGDSQLGRPHFARWLVEAGHLPDEARAFSRYLGRNRPGDVKALWPTLAEVTGWLVAAGGIAVLAHPLQYRFTRMKLRRLVAAFVEAGGEALEVVSGRQEQARTGALRQLAADFGLLVSVGSDFHGDRSWGPRLGVDAAAFRGDGNVWSRLAARDGGGSAP